MLLVRIISLTSLSFFFKTTVLHFFKNCNFHFHLPIDALSSFYFYFQNVKNPLKDLGAGVTRMLDLGALLMDQNALSSTQMFGLQKLWEMNMQFLQCSGYLFNMKKDFFPSY